MEKSSSSAPARPAAGGSSATMQAARKNSSAPTAAARVAAKGARAAAAAGRQPAAKKYKPTDLEQLRGEEPNGRKKPFGLSSALKEQLLARPASKKRRLGISVQRHAQQQRRPGSDENSAPIAPPSAAAAGENPASRRKSSTEKIKAKWPLAVAAAAAAQTAGWYEMPGPAIIEDRPTAADVHASPAPGAPTRAVIVAGGPAMPPTPARAARAAPAAPAPAPVAPAAVSSRADATHPLPAERPAAAERLQQRPAAKAKAKVPSRAGRMHEFFPRLVVPPPVSLSGRASLCARPPKARRYASLPSRDYSDHDSDVDSERDGSGRDGWDPEADHLRWSVEEEEEEEEEEEDEREDGEGGGMQKSDGGSARGKTTDAHHSGVSMGSGSGHESAAGTASEPTGLGSAGAPASAEVAAVVARSTARSETAARAAAAAEKRALASAVAGEGAGPQAAAAAVAVLPGAVLPEAIMVGEELEEADQVATTSGAAAAPASDTRGAGVVEVVEVTEHPPQQGDEADQEAADEALASPSTWPCRRRRGAASLFLSQRQRTGGLRWRGVGVGEAGKGTFRRQALSAVLANGLRTQRLRMGRTSNSRTGAGVARGHPESQGVQGRVAGGVSCMEFDSVGWQLAVGGENVTVYDFDRYLPENAQLKHTLVSGVRAYLQPTDGIQTKRTVSCIRWNPANGEQLAVSYLNYDEIEVYDLMSIHPGSAATPVLTLLPSTGSAAVAAAPASRTGGGAFGRVRVGGGGGGGGSAGAGGASSLSGKFRGLGHLTLEFVRRGPPGKTITHLIAGGRGGVFRVWRFFPEKAKHLAPYLQGQVGASHRGGTSRADVTAVCCLNPDVVLIGTDSGQLVAYSLNMPVVKNFRSSKNADQKKAWYLGASAVWGGGKAATPPCVAANGFCIQFLRLSPDHGTGVVLCGLRGGRVVIFDTRYGRALGITEPHRGVSIGFCPPPAAAPVPTAAATAAAELPVSAPLTEGEGGTDPYSGGHWGPVVLACCKSSEGGEGELVVLATSARAELDCCKRRGDRKTTKDAPKSGLRPGRGWELGEAGGGGFRIEESEGYDLCLPVGVVAATPGQNRVRLSTDARGYLCPRAERRLLRSGLVTSSIMIGKEKHSVEAVNADGTVLVLDRGYRGPAVVAPRGRDDGGAGTGARDATQACPRPSLPRGTSSSNGGGQEPVEVDDGSELDEPEPTGSAGADHGGQGYSRPGNETAAAEAAAAAEGAAGRLAATKTESALRQAGATARGGSTATAAAAVAAEEADSQQPPQQRQENWDRAWRPSGVRVFAKLKAVFGGGDGQQQQQQQQSQNYAVFDAGCSMKEAIFGAGRSKTEVVAAPPFALYQVVARAGLGLPVTAITSHPRMNFVLVGLSDGTVAAVLPQGKREKRLPR